MPPTFRTSSQIFAARVFSSIVLFGRCQWPYVAFIDIGRIGCISIWTTTVLMIASAIAVKSIVMLLMFSRRFICGGNGVWCPCFHHWQWRVVLFIGHWFTIAGGRLLLCHWSAILFVCVEKKKKQKILCELVFFVVAFFALEFSFLRLNNNNNNNKNNKTSLLLWQMCPRTEIPFHEKRK